MGQAASSVPRTVQMVDSAPGVSSPPAIWSAFARQAAWKSWVLLLQLAIIVLLVVCVIGLSHKEPDVVLVTPDGKSTYVNRSVAGDALVRFLADQKQQPSETTVVHFTKDFLNAFLAVNSSTIESAWAASLTMMTPSLRAKMAKEAGAQKLVETFKLMQIQTHLTIEDLALVERFERAMHVRATVARHNKGLLDDRVDATDKLVVDLILVVVPRSPNSPDGLQVAEYRNKVVSLDSSAGLTEGGAAVSGGTDAR